VTTNWFSSLDVPCLYVSGVCLTHKLLRLHLVRRLRLCVYFPALDGVDIVRFLLCLSACAEELLSLILVSPMMASIASEDFESNVTLKRAHDLLGHKSFGG